MVRIRVDVPRLPDNDTIIPHGYPQTVLVGALRATGPRDGHHPPFYAHYVRCEESTVNKVNILFRRNQLNVYYLYRLNNYVGRRDVCVPDRTRVGQRGGMSLCRKGICVLVRRGD